MASSAALHPQFQKDQTGILKPQDLNKISDNVRVKVQTTQLSKTEAENQDPNATKPAKQRTKLMGVSRLPVPVKSLRPAASEIFQGAECKRWEERPLLGKAQKRKMCTKPVPFNFSYPRTHDQKNTGTSSKTPKNSSEPLSRPPRQTPDKTLSVSRHQAKSASTTQNPTSVLSTNSAVAKTGLLNMQSHKVARSKEKMAAAAGGGGREEASFANSIQRDLSTKLGKITLSHSESFKDFSNSYRATEAQTDLKGSAQALLSALSSTGVSETVGSAVAKTPRRPICPSEPRLSVYSAQRVSVKKKGPHKASHSEDAILFSPDPSALRSILLNEGIQVGGPTSKTPRASHCPAGRESIYSAQRVPKKKIMSEKPLCPSFSGDAIPFSPDPTALRSILLNEGVRGEVSTCPSGRESTFYSAQRVPFKKIKAEKTCTVDPISFLPDPSSLLQNEGVKVAGAGTKTPRVSNDCPSGRKTSIYSALRVPIKRGATHAGANQTPTMKGTPQRVPYCNSQSTRKLNSTHRRLLLKASPGFSDPQPSSTEGSALQEEAVVQRLFYEEPEQEKYKEIEDEDKDETLPFIQAPQRQSVIVFSSAQRPEMQDGVEASVIQKLQHAEQFESHTAQSKALTSAVHTTGSQSEQKSNANDAMSSGGLCKTKAPSLSSALCTLRRRMPGLEEMFLDEECAIYTSCQQSWPTHLRCSNPVASTLSFQDSTCFVPISWTSQTLGPISHPSSSTRA